MIESNLKSPGPWGMGQKLRRLASLYISFVEINPALRADAKAFFEDCATKVPDPVTPPGPPDED